MGRSRVDCKIRATGRRGGWHKVAHAEYRRTRGRTGGGRRGSGKTQSGTAVNQLITSPPALSAPEQIAKPAAIVRIEIAERTADFVKKSPRHIFVAATSTLLSNAHSTRNRRREYRVLLLLSGRSFRHGAAELTRHQPGRDRIEEEQGAKDRGLHHHTFTPLDAREDRLGCLVGRKRPHDQRIHDRRTFAASRIVLPIGTLDQAEHHERD